MSTRSEIPKLRLLQRVGNWLFLAVCVSIVFLPLALYLIAVRARMFMSSLAKPLRSHDEVRREKSALLRFHQPPSLIPFVFRGLVGSILKPRWVPAGTRIPLLKAAMNLRLQFTHLDQYMSVCELRSVPVGVVPPLYPQVLTFRLVLALLTHHLFPISLLNVVHSKNRTVHHRAIHSGENDDDFPFFLSLCV